VSACVRYSAWNTGDERASPVITGRSQRAGQKPRVFSCVAPLKHHHRAPHHPRRPSAPPCKTPVCQSIRIACAVPKSTSVAMTGCPRARRPATVCFDIDFSTSKNRREQRTVVGRSPAGVTFHDQSDCSAADLPHRLKMAPVTPKRHFRFAVACQNGRMIVCIGRLRPAIVFGCPGSTTKPEPLL